MLDVISMNILELFHGWRLVDYFEFCNYRFNSRPARWKGAGETADETVSPPLRSVDMSCFSEQFFFMNFMNAVGMIVFLVGLQIIFQRFWNIFNDPWSQVVFLMTLVICKGFQITTVTI